MSNKGLTTLGLWTVPTAKFYCNQEDSIHHTFLILSLYQILANFNKDNATSFTIKYYLYNQKLNHQELDLREFLVNLHICKYKYQTEKFVYVYLLSYNLSMMLLCVERPAVLFCLLNKELKKKYWLSKPKKPSAKHILPITLLY